MDEQLWTVLEVADYLNVKVEWLKVNYQKLGIPYRKLGRNVRFLPTQVRSWTEGESSAA